MSEEDFISVCRYPFENIEIHPDGKVYPCCFVYCKYNSFGNIFEESDFEKIWNSEAAIKYRTSLLNKDYSVCDLNYCQYNCKRKIETPPHFAPKMRTYPKSVKFCHEKQCNVRCITCRDKQCYTSKEQTEKLNSLIEPMFLPILKDCKIVTLNGSGEVFASKHCRTLVKAIVQRYPDIKFAIHSNGLCFDKKNCDELGITDKLEMAEISIHAATKQTYDKIVKDSNFDKVMKNVKWLAKLKKEGKINQIKLDFVITSINYKEMKAFQALANKLNVHTSFTTYRPWGTELSNNYDKVAVFEKFHPEYNLFVNIIQDPIFNSPNCIMQNSLRNLKSVSKNTLLKHKSNIDDKSLLFLFKIRNLYNKIYFYKLDRIFNNFKNKKEKQDYKFLKKISAIGAEEYQENFVKDLNSKIQIKGKNVLEIGSDLRLKTARILLEYGAKSVLCVNPDFPDELKSPDERITVTKELFENIDTQNNTFDIVFGIAILEHVHNVKGLFEKVRDILKPNGFALIQGHPLYCCSCGHHIAVNNRFGFNKKFGPINPFEPWEHLMYDTREDVEQLFIKKGFPKEDIDKMLNQYFSDYINKYSTQDMIDIIKTVSNLQTVIQFEKEFEYEPNEFYKEALKKYSKEELMSRGIIIYARKTK